MGDQLVGADYLLTNVLLFSLDNQAQRRISVKTMERCLLPHNVMMTSVDWASELYRRSLSLAKHHIKEECSMGIVRGMPYRKDPCNDLHGNFLVWKAYNHIMGLVLKKTFIKTMATKQHLTRLNASIESFYYRSGVNVSFATKEKYKEAMLEQQDEICQLTLIEAALWEIHKIRGNDLNRMCKLSETVMYQQQPEFISTELPTNLKIGIDMVVMGPLVYLKMPQVSVLFTKVHFERLAKMLRSTLMLAMMFHELSLKVSFRDFINEFIHATWPIVKEDVDFLGESLKAARAILVCELDQTSISGRPLKEGYMESISMARARNARYLASTMKFMTRSLEDAINLTNIFKMIPHPDANMYELFKSVEGVREPNPVDETLLPRFSGILRRSIFASLNAQGVDVRVNSTDPIANNIVDATYATRKRGAELKTFAATSWACTTFEPIRQFIDINEIEVKASSKSSQRTAEFDEEDLIHAEEYLAGYDLPPPEILFDLRTVNDAASELIGESRLDPVEAIERFERVIALHEEFERGFNGVPIDEIGADELEAFVASHPEASYLVGTEPKFGEIHKKVTRMFYMAEQELKTITQRVERYTKQLCRKQPGVSITKSYSSRRKDLEDYCYTMTGNIPGRRSVYVSFDMSEFSKRFPMALVREFGKVLAELSGHDWLRRIDLVFRASIVIHNSRGYFAHLAGVRGGFEGFFNFIWSSIHATVMEIALESTGSQGQILVFSDDGCLLFQADGWMNEQVIYEKILNIQKIYAKFGLNFHLGKTMVSYNLWEYLGDVCYNNKLLPMWLKEVCSITRYVKTRGLEPYYSKVKSLQAQCDAAVMAGAPVISMYIIKRYLFGTLLDRLGVTYSPRLEELLAIVPTSAGGLRITSPFESTFIGTIEKDAEILADLELIKKIDPTLSYAIVYGIVENMRTSSDVAQTVLTGSRMITDHPDTSGMSAINDAIDLVKNSGKTKGTFPANPIRGEFKANLKELLLTLEKINISMITEFIYSTPSWVEYTNAMALIRSSGVLRLVSRNELKKIQARDTKSVLDSIDKWRGILVSHSRNSIPYRTVRIIERAERTILKGFSVATLRPSPRMAFVSEGNIGGIQVVIELQEAMSFSSLAYPEPRIRLSKDDTTLAWMSESSGALETRSARRFMNTIARILSHSPESESALINIGRLAGIEIPAISPGLLRSAHRLGSGQARDVDAKVFLPRWFMSLSYSRYFGQIGDQVYKYKRADRSTYLEAAKSIAYFTLILNHPKGRVVESSSYTFNYYIPGDLIELIHLPEPMGTRYSYIPNHPVVEVNKLIKDEFHASFMEYYQSALHEEKIMSRQQYSEIKDENDRLMIKEIYISSLKSWLVSTIRSAKSVLIHASEMPLPKIEAYNVIISAVVEAALTLMEPTLRRRLLDILNRWQNGLVRNVDQEYFPANVPDDIVSTKAYQAFISMALDCIDLLREGAPDSYPMLEFNEITINSSEFLGSLLKYSENMTIRNAGRIVVIRGKRYAEHQMTGAHKQAFKEAFTATLSSIYNFCHNAHWDHEAIRQGLGINMDIDDVITCLHVGRELLRESEHRTTHNPYNRKSACIELMKVQEYWNTLLDNLDAMEEQGQDVTDAVLQGLIDDWIPFFTVPEDKMREYINHLPLTQESVDHLAMLDEPILPNIQNRAREVAYILARGHPFGRQVGKMINRRYDTSVESIRGLLSGFYQIIIAPAARSIIEYSVDVEKAVLHEFSPSVPAQAQIMGLGTGYSDILGDFMDFDQESGQFKTDVAEILKELMRDYCLRNFVKGICPAVGSSMMASVISGPLYDSSGLTVSINDDSIDSSLRAYVILHTDEQMAISDYINIVRDARSSAIVFREESSDVIIVAGITDNARLRKSTEPFVNFQGLIWATPGVDIRSLVPRVTFRGTVRGIRASTSLMVSSAASDHIAFSRMQMINSSSRRVDRRSQVNEDSHILQAAYNLLIEARRPNIMFAAYIGIIAWATGFQDTNDIGKMYKAVMVTLNKADERTIKRVISDISMTTMWLAQSNITPGINLRHDLVKQIMSRMITFEWEYRIPPTATIARLRPAKEVREILRNLIQEGVKLLGQISDHVYVLERIVRPAIQAAVLEEKEEDSKEIEELLGLL